MTEVHTNGETNGETSVVEDIEEMVRHSFFYIYETIPYFYLLLISIILYLILKRLLYLVETNLSLTSFLTLFASISSY